jgi:hypothetical protein
MGYQKLQVSKAQVVVPADADILIDGQSFQPCVLYVGTGGTLSVVTEAGDEVVFRNIASGTFLPVSIRRVMPDTSAADILALW